MARFSLLIACALVAIASSTLASAAIVEHTFHVQNLTVEMLCRQQVITAVNGGLPGPMILVQEGDTLIVNVFNESPYNLTIHWHGIYQLFSGWADGPNMITQCPMKPGSSYTYKFKIINQEGTLWWHAHISMLRATVYGAIIILPKSGHQYPFPIPDKEVPILIGEWWNADVMDVANQAEIAGVAPNASDAYTINGKPGDLYPCSQDPNQIYKLNVEKGKTYLLRIINAAVNTQHFFKIANHKFTVVAIDACYTDPYVTDVLVIASGQSMDVLLEADQPVGSYYMAARAYISTPGLRLGKTTTRGLVIYDGATTADPLMPVLPNFYDTPTAYKFYSELTGLADGPQWVPVPPQVDEHMFVTIGLALEVCEGNATCQGPLGQRLSASMNSHSFKLPTSLSILQAYFFNVSGIYTSNFSDYPPVKLSRNVFAPKLTSVKVLKFNSTVEMVLQNTPVLAPENHPMHLHGFDFHVLAQGFGNYNAFIDSKKFNLINPQRRNTIAVPVGGWAVIRFQANNPGVWFMHCHMDMHVPWGLAAAFLVENGPTPSTSLPPPPADLPQC